MESDVAELYRAKALGFVQLHRYGQAIQFFDRARQIYQRHGRATEAAIEDMNKSCVLALIGYYGEALDLLSESKSVFATNGLRRPVAIATGGMANLCHMLRRYDEALELCLEAQEIYETLDEESEAGEMIIGAR